jgi:hypothetical protein
MNPNPKIIITPVWDLETDKIIEMEIGEDFLEEEKRQKEETDRRREDRRRQEREELRYDRS